MRGDRASALGAPLPTPAAPTMPTWGPRLPALRNLRAWLTAPGSLSAQLARAFGPLKVQRGHQGAGRVRRDEAAALGLPAGRRVHVREVTLVCDGVARVSARTVVASGALKGPWRALKGLGSRPLAELLFHDHRVRRAPLAFACIRLRSALGRRLAADWLARTGSAWAGPAVWARRALYRRRGSALLVTEVFAPSVSARRPHAPPRRR